ncbi:MAG: DUF5060 domain-containing protein [Armatimonadetes bacterium]|nr:DUF5060 domain-containing protein [Armatimonadota bacterium]NIM24442.1 DUF5060 domain-containing protein [Armatimonadota bacterium]NIM68313.1 DUF5060 domain-containing protein [Armatimonadota bacterium]NIM76717.1 DUF5060 domain-containing protein [Armatimonadota bacterium]NIN06516.1 DUF5060 domain-containing protein [Armatimonadota bacterium]
MKCIVNTAAFIILLGLLLTSCTKGLGRSLGRRNALEFRQYERFELTIKSPGTFENPFDPAQIDITGEFLTPSRKTVQVPAFYYQPYRRSQDAKGNEILTPDGDAVFKIRFAWGELGEYRYRVIARRKGHSRILGAGEFKVVASEAQGYVRRSETAPLYFQFDSGASYFAIGENMCWPSAGGTYDYDKWMPKLVAHGGNYIRLWLINEWSKLSLEHLSLSPGDGNGLGRYDQQAAWRIDYILERADRLDLKVMMCIDSFNSLDATGIYSQWNRYPYNAANGGPCETPAEFFTDTEAKRLFKQRLRHLVARWGYATQVLSWEFWNEVDIVNDYHSANVAAWHEEMAAYLRSIDSWAHLITTSFANTPGDPEVDGLEQLDYVQSHNYGAEDTAGMIAQISRQKIEAYGKPHYFGEYGTDWRFRENTNDPDGIHLHNGLWAAMLSGSAGTAMTWWWDNYIEPNNLYHHFAPVAAFAADVNWAQENYLPGEVADLRYVPGHEPAVSGTLTVNPPGESWNEGSPLNQPHTYSVNNEGEVTNLAVLSRVQHGLVNHPDWHNPATFLVNYPGPGRFVVSVSGVSGWGGAALSITLDGEQVLAADFADTLPDNHETMHQYDGPYGIDVPAGEHSIVVKNRGADWFFTSYQLTNYLTVPNLRVLALSNPTSALVWVQNKENTWWNHHRGIAPQPVNQSEITLTGFSQGEYEIQHWDTYRGTVVQTIPYACGDGTITLTTPAGLLTDAAYKIKKTN